MKKFFMFAMAAVAMLSVSSCLSEEEVNLTRDGKTGSISVDIRADKSLVTRASTGVSDPTEWFAFIDGEGTANDFGTSATHASLSGLSETKFPFGTYDVTVSNYANIDAAFDDNSGWGAAYYEGTATSQAVAAGGNTNVVVDCGKAQNAKFNIEYSGFDGTASAGLYFVSVVATDEADERTLTFAGETEDDDAFFIKDETVSFTVNWKFDGVAKEATGTIAMAGRGTANKLTITSNANGTITIAATTGITYDNEYSDGTTSTVTVSAQTGAKL